MLLNKNKKLVIGGQMKKLFLPVILLLAILNSSYGQDTLLTSRIKNELVQYSLDPRFGQLVREVMPLLPSYEKTIQSAFSGPTKGMSVDVILQWHKVENDYSKLDSIHYSQLNVYSALQRGKYDLIAFEGVDSDSISERNLFAAAKKLAVIRNIQFDSAIVWNNIIADTIFNSCLLYLKHYPRSLIIGIDDMLLDELSEKIHYTYQGMYGYPDTSLKKISDMIVFDLRNRLAVARTILKLRRLHKTKAALVIGNLHESSIKELLDKYKITGKFIKTF
jgi:hypothetical protein